MLGSIRLGQRVSVTLESANQTVTGKITEIVPAVDPSSRAFLVKASLPPTPLIRSGLFGRLRVPRGSHRQLWFLLTPSFAVANCRACSLWRRCRLVRG